MKELKDFDDLEPWCKIKAGDPEIAGYLVVGASGPPFGGGVV
jgi:hypothetical protein